MRRRRRYPRCLLPPAPAPPCPPHLDAAARDSQDGQRVGRDGAAVAVGDAVALHCTHVGEVQRAAVGRTDCAAVDRCAVARPVASQHRRRDGRRKEHTAALAGCVVAVRHHVGQRDAVDAGREEVSCRQRGVDCAARAGSVGAERCVVKRRVA
eukprot:351937-Chlamydomonas_euryale.AAC.21